MIRNRQRAFTLIELLVVISIISLLSSIVMSTLGASRDKAKSAAARKFAAIVDRTAGDMFLTRWDFNDCSGTSVSDNSGYGYTGTVNSAMWSSSNIPYSGAGCSLVFDGVDDFMDTGYAAGDQSNWTMAGWVYDTKANNGYRAIVQTNVASDDALYIYPGNYLGYWPCNATPSTASFPSNEWVFVTAVYDSATGFKYYLNGVQKGTSGVCADATDWDFLRLGGWGAGDGERWRGNMDNIHIFNKTLTASEVGRLYAYEAARFEKLAKVR